MDIYIFLLWLITFKRLHVVYKWTTIFNHICYKVCGSKWETVPAALCQKKLIWWWYSHVAGHLFVLPAHLRIFYHPHPATRFRYHTVIELYQSAATTLCTIVTILSLSPECYKACMFYPSLIQTHHLITWSPDVVSTECCPAGVRYVRPPHGVVK